MHSSALLFRMFVAGQTDNDLPDAALKPPVATSPPSEPGLLMPALRETRLGPWLDRSRIQISGWADGSFTASSASQQQLPMGFNYEANQFLLQQNWIRFERTVLTSGTTEPTFGFRTDTIVPGSDYRFTVARGLFSGQLTDNDGGPNTYGFDPVQFYGQVCLPNLWHGLDIKLGRMFCQFGEETLDAPSNALASHSYTFIYDPYTHTGVMGAVQVSPEWSFQLGAMLGPDVFIDPAASPYGMATIKWAPPDCRSSVLVSGLIGSGRFDVDEQFNNPNVVDFVVIHKFSPQLTYTLDALFGYQTNVPDVGTATWFGIVNYVTCELGPKWKSTARLEFFDDVDGTRTGFSGLYTAATAGLNFQPRPEFILRPEVRYDYNGDSRPFDGQHGLLTATADFIVRW